MATDPIGAAGLPPQTSQARTDTNPPETDAVRSKPARGESSAAPASTPDVAPTGEKLQISPKARELLELKDLMSAARKSLDEHPDVRADRIREVRERLRAGVYDTGAIRDELAHRLASIFKNIPLDS